DRPRTFSAPEGCSLAAASPVGRSSPRARRPTILVVEDEGILRWMIAEELRGKGFVVLEAANSDEALGILQTSARVTVVMKAVRRPGAMDGIGLARWGRARRPDPKPVMASAHAPADTPQEFADAHFLKPYDIDRLVERIREFAVSR